MEVNKKRKILISIGSCSGILVLIVVLGMTFGWFNFYQQGSNNQVIVGDIYLNLVDGNDGISLTNVFPETKEEARDATRHVEGEASDNTFTFTVQGKNETDKTIYYEIQLARGDQVENKIRFEDRHLKFDLIEVGANNAETYLIRAISYEPLNDSRLYVATVAPGQTINRTYKVRMWLSDNLLISDDDPNADYNETGEHALKNYFGSVKVAVLGDFTVRGTNNLYNTLLSSNPTLDTSINFGQTSAQDNTSGLYKMNSTASDDYPILYYRGGVTNNNVYFAGFCWKIVRTTDTGGIKLIYSGSPTSDATHDVICDNTIGATTTILSSAFNSNNQSLAYVGYMYGDVYEWTNAYSNGSADNEGAYYGTGFNYENGVYSLKGAKLGIDNTHHYSCNSTSENGTCESIRYYYYYGVYSGTTYHMYITLTGGDSVLDALNKMKKNVNNSTAKTAIDSWYGQNMTDYTSKLEDTIWCNDRSIYSLGGLNESGGDLTSNLYFNGVKRRNTNPRTPSLECQDKNDAFTVSNAKGNKALTYPVALITSDEIMLAGGQAAENKTYYLYTGAYHWSLSPYGFGINNASVFYVFSSGYLNYDYVYYSNGLRPAVSLKPGTTFLSGDGTGNTPYIID